MHSNHLTKARVVVIAQETSFLIPFYTTSHILGLKEVYFFNNSDKALELLNKRLVDLIVLAPTLEPFSPEQLIKQIRFMGSQNSESSLSSTAKENSYVNFLRFHAHPCFYQEKTIDDGFGTIYHLHLPFSFIEFYDILVETLPKKRTNSVISLKASYTKQESNYFKTYQNATKTYAWLLKKPSNVSQLL